ncbi:TetR family transcriptional regulator [Cellulomonas denverensis]|uniref:TetR family transcriptional regulator n=1 Tax=Cellulomonas denverensis TaxID=264297 RepID=UPI0035E67E19
MSGSGVPQAPNLGLRARNRQRAMHEIQRVALDLFDARGFDAVTVEEVAAMAEVSASTVYRYFGTKDRLVLHDDIDRQLVTGLLAALDEGATLGEAARLVLGTLREMPAGEFRSFARRIRYMLEQPTVAAALSQEARATAAELTAEIAKRRGESGRRPGGPAVRAAADRGAADLRGGLAPVRLPRRLRRAAGPHTDGGRTRTDALTCPGVGARR